MAEDLIRYDELAQDALRGVIRTVLKRVANTGLPGEHHLYIAFDTHAEGVSISERLQEQYPEEMTVVLQYQFWDLEVSEERFEVKLAFNNIPERLVVPFRAIRAFYDPSVQFGLQFGEREPAPEAEPHALAGQETPSTGAPAAGEQAGEKEDLPEPAGEPAAEGAEAAGAEGAEVVELDTFRKKK